MSHPKPFVTVQVVGRASRLPGGRLALALSPGNAGETPGAAGETPAPLPEQLQTLRRYRLVGALAAALLMAAGAVAQIANDFAQPTNQTPGLAVTFQPGESVGLEQVIRASLRSGTNEFMFVVPEGLRVEAASEGMIALAGCDRSYYVIIRFVAPPPSNLELKEALRERVASQYARASSLQEFTTTVADRAGTGVQLWQALAGMGERRISVIGVPFNAGVLEFTLNADKASAAAGQGAFDMILLTFRSNERGKIEVVRRSDKS